MHHSNPAQNLLFEKSMNIRDDQIVSVEDLSVELFKNQSIAVLNDWESSSA